MDGSRHKYKHGRNVHYDACIVRSLCNCQRIIDSTFSSGNRVAMISMEVSRVYRFLFLCEKKGNEFSPKACRSSRYSIAFFNILIKRLIFNKLFSSLEDEWPVRFLFKAEWGRWNRMGGNGYYVGTPAKGIMLQTNDCIVVFCRMPWCGHQLSIKSVSTINRRDSSIVSFVYFKSSLYYWMKSNISSLSMEQ
jgi:hypothetical protein